MERKQFLQSGLPTGAASLLSSNSAFAAVSNENDLDKLADVNGNFIQAPLPFAESFLESCMDAETMHLHYTYHHGGAVKAANNDLKDKRCTGKR